MTQMFVLSSVYRKPVARYLVLFVPALLAFVLLFFSSRALALPPLEELELRTKDGPEVLAAIAAMNRDSFALSLESQREGGKYFFNAGLGYSDEPEYIGSENNVSYKQFTLGAGVVFPLLGTWNSLKINRMNAEIRALDSRFRPQLLSLKNLAALRRAYSVLWIEAKKITLARNFLALENETMRVLGERTGTSLLLEADRLEFLSAFKMVKRNLAVSELKKVQALQIIRLATGERWEMPEAVDFPSMPQAAGMKADIINSPQLLAARAGLKKYEGIAAVSRHTDRESSITAGITGSKEFPGDYGSGVYLAFNFSEPLKERGSKEDKSGLAAQANYERAAKELDYLQLKLEGEAAESFAYTAYAAANIEAQESRLRAIDENIREKLLRHDALAGDTFEQLQKSRYQYYLVATDLLDSQLLKLQGTADILSYIYPGGRADEPTARESDDNSAIMARIVAPNWQISQPNFTRTAKIFAFTAARNKAATELLPERVYIWHAAAFLNPSSAEASLKRLRERNVTTALISFTAQEVHALSGAEEQNNLKRLFVLAGKYGISFELLLGDPSWLLPENRKALTSLINSLAAFPFSGVHLDIEPDSLPETVTAKLNIPELLACVYNDAAQAAEMPVSISIHPRYLEGRAGDLLIARINAAAIKYIAPMIYSTNTLKTAARMEAIISKFPQFKFFLAQSTEKQLPAEESYYEGGLSEFTAAMNKISSILRAYRNFQGIIVQDWKNYEEMR